MEQKINGGAKEWTDTFVYVWDAILTVWSGLPTELKAYILTMFTISILLQWVKKAILVNCTKKERIQKLWLYGFPLGLMLAFTGWYLSGEKVHTGYWVMVGLTVNTVAMGVHRVTVDYIWPVIKSIKSLRITTTGTG